MIGVNSYALDGRVVQVMEILDLAITLFFLVELSIRFLGEPEKRAFFRQGWNVFDTLIVTVSLVPIDESELALLGRLIRIFRVLRMVSIVPELRVLVNSLLRALPQLGYVCLLCPKDERALACWLRARCELNPRENAYARIFSLAY